MQNHEIWHEPGPGVSVQAGGEGGGRIGLLNPPGRPATEKHRKRVQNLHFPDFMVRNGSKNVEIEGVGPIWRAPG